MNSANAPKGITSPRKEAPARLDRGTSQGKALPLRFSFYSVMRPQRVFPFTVAVRDGAAAVLANAHSLTIKPSIPGALVEPSEHLLDATKPKNSVTFQVTPIAKGKMPNANVKVSQQGHLLQEVPVGMKSKTQRLTWILALSTLLLPILVTYYTKDHPLRGTIPRAANSGGEAAAASNEKPKDEPKKEGADKGEPKKEETNNKVEPKPDGAPPRAAGGQGRPGGGLRMAGPPTPPGRGELGSGQSSYREFGTTPGVYLEYLVKRSAYDALPQVKYVVWSEPSTVLDNKPSDALSWVAWSIGYVYEFMCNTPSIGPIVFALMLGLTTISWLWHRSKRRNLNKVINVTPELRPA